MSRALAAITFESEPVYDAALTLGVVLDRLVHRHGAEFRALEVRLLGLVKATVEPGFKSLELGRIVMIPPQEWTDALAEARRLGVI